MRRAGSLAQHGALVLLLLVALLWAPTCLSAEDSQGPQEGPNLEAERPAGNLEDPERMRNLDEFVRYMVNDVLFPIEGIVKGYCLYRAASDDLREGVARLSKESIVVATILLSGKWRNPLGFISRCRESLRVVSNGMVASSLESSGDRWASVRSARKATKVSRIRVCLKAKICSRMMKKQQGMENLRSFLLSRTQYGLIYPSQGSEMAVWNTIREFKDILSAGILRGSIKNHIRVIIMFNYMNKVLDQIGKHPVSLLVCIALINSMVRERSLSDWLSLAKAEPGLDPVTNLRYNPDLTIRENIGIFQARTCNHVIWASGIVLSDRQIQVIGENSTQIHTLRSRISWMCNKMFAL